MWQGEVTGGLVAARAVVEELDPPHTVRMGHYRGSLKSFLNPNDNDFAASTCLHTLYLGPWWETNTRNAQRLQGNNSLTLFYWCSHGTAPQWKNQLFVGSINMGNNLWQSP